MPKPFIYKTILQNPHDHLINTHEHYTNPHENHYNMEHARYKLLCQIQFTQITYMHLIMHN
jgi:hypothetical protein